MDIKIDAVFSLVNGGDENKNAASRPENEQNNESMEPDKVDVVIKQEKVDPGYDNATDWENDWWKRIPDDAPELKDWSTEDDVKPFPFQDGDDSPPALLIQNNHPVLRSLVYDRSRDLMSPPVLLPQVDMMERSPETETGLERPDQMTPLAPRKCMKIHPCYIVLTNVSRYLKGNDKISHRSFRRKYRDCPNICKHKQFRRKLNSGYDVFNVRVPSKTKGYRAYLEVHRLSNIFRKNEKKRSSPKVETRYKDLIQRYANSVNAGGAGRIMRSIQSMPKDFRKDEHVWREAILKKSAKVIVKSSEFMKNIREVRNQVIDETEKEIEFKRELSKLKRQIDFQRSSRKAAKKYLLSGNVPGYFKSGTSSVSGRVRKTNTKYGDDYLKSRDELVYHQSLQTINKRLIRENKKAEEADKLKKEKKREKEKFLEKQLESTFQFVIDNPEEIDENMSVMTKNGKVTTYSMLSREEKDQLNARHRKIYKRKKASMSKGIKDMSARKKKKMKHLDSNKDGVIIKDIQYGALADLLLSEDMANTENKEDTESAESDGSIDVGDNITINVDQFSHARSILKKSVNENATKVGIIKDNQSVTQINNLPHSCTMDPDRAKALRIPEKVRMLFTKDKTIQSPNGTTSSGMSPGLSNSAQVIRKVIDTPTAIMTSPGEPQKFIITSDGLVKRVEQVKGVVLPHPVKTSVSSTSSNIGIARQLLKNAVLKSQPEKHTQSVYVANDLGSQAVKVKAEKPSDGYPDSTESQPQLNPDKPHTVHVVASKQSKAQQNVNIQLVEEGTKTNKNLYYQFYMGGKKYLVPAAPGLGQQNVVLNPSLNVGEIKTTSKITPQEKVEVIKQGNQTTATLGTGPSSIIPIGSNSMTPSMTNQINQQQRVPVTKTANTYVTVSQPSKLYTPHVDNYNMAVDKAANERLVSSEKKFQSPSVIYSFVSNSNESPGTKVPSVKPMAIPIRFVNPVPRQDSKNNVKVVGGTQSVLSNNGQQFSTHASQTLVKMLDSQNISLVDPNSKQIITVSKPMNIMVNQAPKTAVINPVPMATSLNSVSINTLIDPKALNALTSHKHVASALSPTPTAVALNKGPSTSAVNPASSISTVSPSLIPKTVNPIQFPSPVNCTPGESNLKSKKVATVVNRAAIPLGVRFVLVPSTLNNNPSTLHLVSTAPGTLNTTPSLSTSIASQAVSSVASSNTLANSSCLNRNTALSNQITIASDAVGISSQSQTKLASMLSQKASQTQLVQNRCVDHNPEIIKVPVSKPSETEKTEEKPVPFAEAVSAREERLKKLKETLKEKQVALEKLRQQRMNKDSDIEDK